MAISMARAQSMSEPTMALARPPGEPAAGVLMVNTARFSPASPWLSSE